MKDKGKFYITTAIAYSSRKPHFGNTYEVIMTDALARFKRQVGYDVFFLTGTDEHGQKIENYAKEEGISPKDYVDKVSAEIRRIWDLMGASYDKFIRTTDDYHVRSVQHIFKKLYDKGDIYKGHYEGWYCSPCESFFTETQVVDGKCPDCGAPVSRAQEEAYFFKMSNYADKLMQYIEAHPEFIEPEARKKEMVNNFLKAGLQDLCVSRSSFKWGIPITFDEKHVTYVWIDALSNYITALGYDPDNAEQPELFNKFWPADVHIIGKDILRFHTIYWPIILMALDIPLPKKVFGHPWFNLGADKMSKSKGNVIYADELAEVVGVDGVRYEEFFITAFDGDVMGLYDYLTEYENLDELNHLAHLISELDSDEIETLEAVLNKGDHTSSVADIINLVHNLDCYELHPGVTDDETLGRIYVEDMELLDVPDNVLPYFDFEAYGRDMRINEGGHFAPTGYLTRSGDFKEVYHGIEDIPAEHRIFAYPKLNIREQMAAYKEVIDRSSLEGERLHPRKEHDDR